MKIKVFDNEADWLQFKKGKFSASEIHRLLSDAKREMTDEEKAEHKKQNPKSTAKLIIDDSLLSEGALTYVFEKFTETVADDIQDPFINNDMMHGIDTEPVVFAKFETQFPEDEIMQFGGTQYAFVIYNERAGASLDSLCPKKFVGEFKCPTSKEVHNYRVMFVRDWQALKKHDPKIYAQIQFEMMCAEVPLGYLVSYYEGMKNPEHVAHRIEIPQDKPFQALIERKVAAGDKEFDRLNQVYQSLTTV